MAKRRSWDELVRLGREASLRISDAKWTLGDLALEVEPMWKAGQPRGVERGLQGYALEVGVSPSSLREYRDAASKWPALERQPGVSFSVHLMLRHRSDRVALLKEMVETASREGRRVVICDAKRALGHIVHPAGARVAVQDYERRFPGTAKPTSPVVSMGKPVDTAKRIIDNLKPGQIGELIEYAWSVLEGRQAA